jgi:hypothetical protein
MPGENNRTTDLWEKECNDINSTEFLKMESSGWLKQEDFFIRFKFI